jgi:glycosyltransferase involved in cell wall biosynthesis
MNQTASVHADSLKHIPVRKASRLPSTLVCFSHLRWDFVYQRPQHLLSRFAKDMSVHFIEEPVYDDGTPRYVVTQKAPNLNVLVPHLPNGTAPDEAEFLLRNLLNGFMATRSARDTAFWYYTPMALSFSSHINPAITIFDCMDELSAFRFAPARLKQLEQNLLSRSDIVFTGGQSLYEAKKSRHVNIHAFPSSIDYSHFAKARNGIAEPEDNVAIPGPRFGFYGVVDERFDIDLLREVADQKPDWHFVIVGPVVKIDEASLPRNTNIHYLGGRSYAQLPAYLKGWDVAIMPFAMNESTKYISPTKTPEYLAGGKPVISTPINDVVHPYGDEALVHIAADAASWVAAGEELLAAKDEKDQWLKRVDTFLLGNSWDQTYLSMKSLIINTLNREN